MCPLLVFTDFIFYMLLTLTNFFISINRNNSDQVRVSTMWLQYNVNRTKKLKYSLVTDWRTEVTDRQTKFRPSGMKPERHKMTLNPKTDI